MTTTSARLRWRRSKLVRGGDVVGVRRRRLHVVQLAHQEVQRVDALARRDDALVPGGSAEGHGADRVALAAARRSQQHHRVQHLVEVRAADAVRDASSARMRRPQSIEQHHALVALVLELAHDRACRRAAWPSSRCGGRHRRGGIRRAA